mmetsp:Transcript_42519/g.97427  ORF Transcript_42519/g.97427 Transcript_42519/m.97427 type:complete len:377 (-) Transcript_42519:1656-2786(-)
MPSCCDEPPSRFTAANDTTFPLCKLPSTLPAGSRMKGVEDSRDSPLHTTSPLSFATIQRPVWPRNRTVSFGRNGPPKPVVSSASLHLYFTTSIAKIWYNVMRSVSSKGDVAAMKLCPWHDKTFSMRVWMSGSPAALSGGGAGAVDLAEDMRPGGSGFGEVGARGRCTCEGAVPARCNGTGCGAAIAWVCIGEIGMPLAGVGCGDSHWRHSFSEYDGGTIAAAFGDIGGGAGTGGASPLMSIMTADPTPLTKDAIPVAWFAAPGMSLGAPAHPGQPPKGPFEAIAARAVASTRTSINFPFVLDPFKAAPFFSLLLGWCCRVDSQRTADAIGPITTAGPELPELVLPACMPGPDREHWSNHSNVGLRIVGELPSPDVL